jgi:hypothetical protein
MTYHEIQFTPFSGCSMRTAGRSDRHCEANGHIFATWVANAHKGKTNACAVVASRLITCHRFRVRENVRSINCLFSFPSRMRNKKHVPKILSPDYFGTVPQQSLYCCEKFRVPRGRNVPRNSIDPVFRNKYPGLDVPLGKQAVVLYTELFGYIMLP